LNDENVYQMLISRFFRCFVAPITKRSYHSNSTNYKSKFQAEISIKPLGVAFHAGARISTHVIFLMFPYSAKMENWENHVKNTEKVLRNILLPSQCMASLVLNHPSLHERDHMEQ